MCNNKPTCGLESYIFNTYVCNYNTNQIKPMKPLTVNMFALEACGNNLKIHIVRWAPKQTTFILYLVQQLHIFS